MCNYKTSYYYAYLYQIDSKLNPKRVSTQNNCLQEDVKSEIQILSSSGLSSFIDFSPLAVDITKAQEQEESLLSQ